MAQLHAFQTSPSLVTTSPAFQNPNSYSLPLNRTATIQNPASTFVERINTEQTPNTAPKTRRPTPNSLIPPIWAPTHPSPE